MPFFEYSGIQRPYFCSNFVNGRKFSRKSQNSGVFNRRCTTKTKERFALSIKSWHVDPGLPKFLSHCKALLRFERSPALQCERGIDIQGSTHQPSLDRESSFVCCLSTTNFPGSNKIKISFKTQNNDQINLLHIKNTNLNTLFVV